MEMHRRTDMHWYEDAKRNCALKKAPLADEVLDVLAVQEIEEQAAALEILHPVFGRIVNGVFHS